MKLALDVHSDRAFTLAAAPLRWLLLVTLAAA